MKLDLFTVGHRNQGSQNIKDKNVKMSLLFKALVNNTDDCKKAINMKNTFSPCFTTPRKDSSAKNVFKNNRLNNLNLVPFVASTNSTHSHSMFLYKGVFKRLQLFLGFLNVLLRFF